MDAAEWRDAIEVLRDPTRMCERVMEDGNIPVSATIQQDVYVRHFYCMSTGEVQMGHTVVTPCPASPATDHHFRRALLFSLCPFNGDGIYYGLRRVFGVVVVRGSWGFMPIFMSILRRRNSTGLLV